MLALSILQDHKKGCRKVREIDISHVLAEAVRYVSLPVPRACAREEKASLNRADP